MNIEFYFKHTADDAIEQREEDNGFVTITKYGNEIHWNTERKITFMKWISPQGVVFEINNPEFNEYYLESYSENMERTR